MESPEIYCPFTVSQWLLSSSSTKHDLILWLAHFLVHFGYCIITCIFYSQFVLHIIRCCHYCVIVIDKPCQTNIPAYNQASHMPLIYWSKPTLFRLKNVMPYICHQQGFSCNGGGHYYCCVPQFELMLCTCVQIVSRPTLLNKGYNMLPLCTLSQSLPMCFSRMGK